MNERFWSKINKTPTWYDISTGTAGQIKRGEIWRNYGTQEGS